MTTPNTQPNDELDKAIEQADRTLSSTVFYSETFKLIDETSLKEIRNAAKRLKEHEADEDSQNQHKVDLISERDKLKQNLHTADVELATTRERLKEVEKERDEFRRTEPLKKQERDFFYGFYFDCIQNTPHSECVTELEAMAKVIHTLKEANTLRTEYKKALVALKWERMAHNSTPDEIKQDELYNNILSTPSAIKVMKGEV